MISTLTRSLATALALAGLTTALRLSTGIPSAPVATPPIDNPKAPGRCKPRDRRGLLLGVQGVFEHVRG